MSIEQEHVRRSNKMWNANRRAAVTLPLTANKNGQFFIILKKSPYSKKETLYVEWFRRRSSYTVEDGGDGMALNLTLLNHKELQILCKEKKLKANVTSV